MMIDVTEEDIWAARYDDGTPAATCPIARAVTRALGFDLDDERVMVGAAVAGGIVVDGSEYPVPLEVDTFVNDFDADDDVEPFSFEWDGPR